MTGSSATTPSLYGIRASAGSGKTYRLTIEYLRHFFDGADADSVLATTFTRTAANEILNRVLRRMAEACLDQSKLVELAIDLRMNIDRTMVQNQLRRFCSTLERVSIGTIDSFFSGISTCYRYESSIALGGSIYDENGRAAKRCRIEALRNVLAHPDYDKLVSMIEQLQGGIPGRSVVSGIDDMLRDLLPLFQITSPDQWWASHVTYRVDESEIKELSSKLCSYSCSTNHKTYAKTLASAVEHVRVRDWQAFLQNGIVTRILSGERSYCKVPIPDDLCDLLALLIVHARSEVISAHAVKTRATFELLSMLSPEYNKLRSAQGMIFFSDVAIALSKLMAGVDDDEVAYRLNRHIDHLLLDEFQDTDPQQWKILRPFTDRISRLPQGDSSVFWVGDVKQAIYGWRGANAGIFSMLDTTYPQMQWEELSKSYRSSQIVLDAVNNIFLNLHSCDRIAHRNTEYQSAVAQWCAGYVAHEAHYDLPGYVSIIRAPHFDVEETQTGDEEQTDKSVETESDPSYVNYVADKVANIYREMPQRSIGVLTRTNQMADAIVFHLVKKGVPAAALAGAPLLSDPAAALIMAALNLADRPSDLYAAFRVLNSPLADVLGLKHLKLWHLKEVSQSIRTQLAIDGYAETFVRWAKVVAPHCDEHGAMRLAVLVELADQFDLSPGLRPRDFLDIASDAGCADSVSAPVQVMSIHKAKGLEFDQVILPELHKRIPGKTPLVLTATDPATLEITAVERYPGKEAAKLNKYWNEILEQYHEKEIKECLCLLYVALTRARYGLMLITPPKKADALSLAALVSDRLCRKDQCEDMEDNGLLLYESGNRNWCHHIPTVRSRSETNTFIEELPAAPRMLAAGGRRIRHHAAPSSVAGWGKVRAEQIIGSESREGRRTGSIIHAFFQKMGWMEDGLPDTVSLVQNAREACPEARLDRIHREVQLFNKMLEIADIRDALSRPSLLPGQSADLWVERPFAVFVNGKFVSGVFDRVVVKSQNGKPVSAHLLDFKTNRMTGSSLGQEVEKYRSQMQTYREALSVMLGLPETDLVCSVVFPGAGAVRNV